MRVTLCALICVGLLPRLTGCWSSPDQPQPAARAGLVAVIDLDEVARQLGRDVEVAEAIQQQEAAMNQQLATLQASYQQQIDKKQQQLASQPNEEQNQMLDQLRQQAALQLSQARQQAQSRLVQHRAELVNAFREQVKPVALQVAAERGLSIVITRNNSLFAYDQAVDITDAVAARMREQTTEQPAPPAPLPDATRAAKRLPPTH